MKIVLDTSIIIDKLRGGRVWETLISDVDLSSEVYIPTVVIFELFSGQSTRKTEVVKKINQFLKPFPKLDFDAKIAQRAGQIFRDLPTKVDVPDYIVAASALEIGAYVATANTKHFSKIPGLLLLN